MNADVIVRKKEYPGLDLFRIIAVILVVMNHTYPLADINEIADFTLTRIIARIAVPFFFMVSGFFVLPTVMGENKNYNTLFKSVKKLAKLYIIATLIYLPISFYSGNIGLHSGISGILKDIFFNGTFYHLWYLPAAIIGILIVTGLLKVFKPIHVFMISIGLYIIGVFGDSYYQISQQLPVIKEVYNGIFMLFDYTRNGIFLAPIFFISGAMIAKQTRKPKKKIMMYGFIASLLLMIIEGLILNRFNIQKHSSMYILLLPVMYFLFQWLLLWKNGKYKQYRNITMIVYIIHPLVIIGVRGVAKIINLQAILVDNNMIHFIIVFSASWVVAIGINFILSKKYIKKHEVIV